MIRLENIRKSYGDLQAVKGISLEIAKGETFGLLGPNGAGKTTTINILIGVLRPDSGTVHIDGSADPTQSSIRRKIGSSPQAIALYGDLTAEENLRFFGKLYGQSGATLRRRVEFCLELSGLSSRRRDRVNTYSGGMMRRLNLACAVVHDPQVLLLDEPTVGVDPQSRSQIFDTIESLKRQGRTIIYTTHYMEEAQRLCDRVAIIDQGSILAMDSVDGLIREHGGDSIIEAELAERPPDAVHLPGELDGAMFRAVSSKPFELVAQLSSSGVRFLTVKIQQADLEQVFLNLTGRRLRD